MRFPPFAAESHVPSEMPVTEVCWEDDGRDMELDLGDESGWFVNMVRVPDRPSGVNGLEQRLSEEEKEKRIKARDGWSLSPHPFHFLARRWIPLGVVLLITAIFLHVLEPVLLRYGLISKAMAGSVEIGLLDYPILFVAATPFVLIPILLRMYANIADIRRQHGFSKEPLPSPEIQVNPNSSTESLSFTMNLSEELNNYSVTGHLRVGLLPPVRSALLSALCVEPNSRPPHGQSTSIPAGWMDGTEDGSGIGEATPMLVKRGGRRLFEEPMRLGESGQSVPLSPGECNVPELEERWPGSYYGNLVSVHWELVLTFKKEGERAIRWIESLSVAESADGHYVPLLNELPNRLERL